MRRRSAPAERSSSVLSTNKRSYPQATLAPSPLMSQGHKDYSGAFATLQSKYGLSGTVPSLPVFHSAPKRSSLPSSSTRPSSPESVNSTGVSRSSMESQRTLVRDPHSPQARNYESALGELSSSYGFGFGRALVPSLPSVTARRTSKRPGKKAKCSPGITAL